MSNCFAHLDPQAQRMMTLGLMAGAVAHDINNLLTVLMASASCATAALAEDHPAQADLLTIQQVLAHMGGLTHQLLGYMRKPVDEQGLVDLGALVEDLRPLIRQIAGAKIRVTMATAPDLRPVYAERNQIEQLLLNLLLNARDAMPAGGRVTIGVAHEILTAESGLAPGSYVRLAIADTGMGIQPEALGRIFEPFYSTKGPGNGTGLGLVICQHLATRLGGCIMVSSVVGQGSEFVVYLPCAG